MQRLVRIFQICFGIASILRAIADFVKGIAYFMKAKAGEEGGKLFAQMT